MNTSTENLTKLLNECKPLLEYLASLTADASRATSARRITAAELVERIDADVNGILTAKQRRAAIIDDLKRFHGIPPYEGDFSAHDGLFARALEEKYKANLAELEEEVNFQAIKAAWQVAKQDFITSIRDGVV